MGRIIPSTIIENAAPSQKTAYLQLDSNLLYRQTLNNCAPYSAMAVINLLTGKLLDPELLARQTTWRVEKNLTLPQGLLGLLAKYTIKTRESVLNIFSASEKINWLKNRIIARHPVILLVKVHHVQHFLTVLGYNEQGFFLYDSMQDKSPGNPRKTRVDSEVLSGNRFYANAELLGLWDSAGAGPFYRNWAVECSI